MTDLRLRKHKPFTFFSKKFGRRDDEVRKNAPENAVPGDESPFKATVISGADAAKVHLPSPLPYSFQETRLARKGNCTFFYQTASE